MTYCGGAMPAGTFLYFFAQVCHFRLWLTEYLCNRNVGRCSPIRTMYIKFRNSSF